ncbi:beta-galactoside alpha-2,6-sialyltransferase 2-like [Panonychus citri]|uniref:beta-galactoside alpha-2,6-sialyltransferase 2-like n=1 Tax=Panonychus citri TaxID=50023 RepID=UPI002306FF3C|nr:beta-galactoside alpha-2,6-sialyltransferase 2-like [Panonychus citri]XP_053212030.1 beta-galactoside alpha-2,6-sialyltransferase 2-like [Panonychus citri]
MKLLGCAICFFIGVTLFSSGFYFYLIISQYMISSTYQAHRAMFKNMVDSAKGLIISKDESLFQSSNDIENIERQRKMNLSTSFDHDLRRQIEVFLVRLRSKLRSWELRSTSILWRQQNSYNRYNVTYLRSPPTYPSVTRLCTVPFTTISPTYEPFSSNGFDSILPKESLIKLLREKYPVHETCALIANSGSLLKSSKGSEIDSHDVIIRFNDAPTIGYEMDVGSRTSIRIINSQVASRLTFNLSDPLYSSAVNLVWDPSSFQVDLNQWFNKPDHNFFPNYRKTREKTPNIPFYIIHPQVAWDLWKQLQTSKSHQIHRTPPSSGFIGLLLGLRLCSYVYAYEYIPSIRMTENCHYYDNTTGLGCTFGDWHPLATEKLYALHLNTASDYDLAINGRMRTRGCG